VGGCGLDAKERERRQREFTLYLVLFILLVIVGAIGSQRQGYWSSGYGALYPPTPDGAPGWGYPPLPVWYGPSAYVQPFGYGPTPGLYGYGPPGPGWW